MFMPSGLFSKTLQRKGQTPWETLGHWEAAPIPMCGDTNDDVEIVAVDRADAVATYTADVECAADVLRAVTHARAHLLKQVTHQHWHALVEEGWQVTLLRSGSRRRVDVVYIGRAARTAGGSWPEHDPPFVGLLSQIPVA